MNDKWIIECRNPDGTLNFEPPQPEGVFGMAAINGMTDDYMAKVIYARRPDDVVMRGDNIAAWPQLLDPRWIARRKTW